MSTVYSILYVWAGPGWKIAGPTRGQKEHAHRRPGTTCCRVTALELMWDGLRLVCFFVLLSGCFVSESFRVLVIDHGLKTRPFGYR